MYLSRPDRQRPEFGGKLADDAPMHNRTAFVCMTA
jgi:hypothetical protein